MNDLIPDTFPEFEAHKMRHSRCLLSIKQFLQIHADETRPILVAVSGGADSLALLYYLLMCPAYTFAVAHVDHGWRATSGKEAEELCCLIKKLNLPFHLKTLDPECLKGNLEACCRQERQTFFASVCAEFNYQAVVLAHHADDLSETVLKRIFEGASLPCLFGMNSVADLNGLKVWRPLLGHTKEELSSDSERLGLKPFVDSTNLDSQFLRGRFRTTITPLLSEVFGKEIAKPLSRLSKESLEWRSYLDGQVRPILSKVEKHELGIFWDLSNESRLSMVELKHALRGLLEENDLFFSFSQIECAAEFLIEKKANKCLTTKKCCAHIDRGRLFIPKRRVDVSDWEIIAQSPTGQMEDALTGWRQALKGNFRLYLPKGTYHLESACFKRWPVLDQLWTSAKVPAFLRHAVPVLSDNRGHMIELLTGAYPKQNPIEDLLYITVKSTARY